jgi:hypothetical protein
MLGIRNSSCVEIFSVFRIGPDSEGPTLAFSYCDTENWDKARVENPHVREPAEIRKSLEDQWNAMTPKERAPYKKGLKAHEDRFHRMALAKIRARSRGAPYSSVPLPDRTPPV